MHHSGAITPHHRRLVFVCPPSPQLKNNSRKLSAGFLLAQPRRIPGIYHTTRKQGSRVLRSIFFRIPTQKCRFRRCGRCIRSWPCRIGDTRRHLGMAAGLEVACSPVLRFTFFVYQRPLSLVRSRSGTGRVYSTKNPSPRMDPTERPTDPRRRD